MLFTDDEDEAWAELRSRRASAGYEHGPRYRGWDMAKVIELDNPPKTARIWCVFQIEGNK